MAKILVIDDDEMLLSLFKDVIELLGHEAIPMHKAESALESLSAGLVVDLMITDVVMPGMDGQELVKAIIKSPKIKPFPILMISGEVFGRDLSDVLAHDRVTFVQKPIRISDLIAAINVRICSTVTP